MKLCTPIAFGLALSLCACVDSPDDEVALVNDELPAEIRLDRPAPWFGAFEYGAGWTKDQLTVCWDASAFGADAAEEVVFADARSWVQYAVDGQWGRLGRMRFGWWGPCSADIPADIRIGHSDDLAGASVLGNHAAQITSGPTMLINLRGPSSAGCVGQPDQPPPGGGVVIARCNGVLLGGDPPSREVWTEAVALHTFGLALGLRHEEARADAPSCLANDLEVLDDSSHDGEPLWTYDGSSIMQSCNLQSVAFGTATPKLSLGDLKALDTLYPAQVRVFSVHDFAGTTATFGPGAYLRADSSALWNVDSMIIPPGTRVQACTSSACWTYSATVLDVPTTLASHITTFTITPSVVVADGVGFTSTLQWLGQGTFTASQLATVGDNRISSAWVPPTLAATLCDTSSGGACVSTVGGTIGLPWLVKFLSIFGTNLDNRTSWVSVSSRAVASATADFRGQSYALATGIYKVSTGSSYLPAIRSIATSGLEVVACSGENPLAFPRPTCQTFTRSGAVTTALAGNIKYLDVHAPLVNAP